MNLKVLVFDADETLWVNEPYFIQVEEQFYQAVGGIIYLSVAHKRDACGSGHLTRLVETYVYNLGAG